MSRQPTGAIVPPLTGAGDRAPRRAYPRHGRGRHEPAHGYLTRRPRPLGSGGGTRHDAAGLQVSLALAEPGVDGHATLIERQASRADLLRDRPTAAGWEVVNDTPLPVVCFTHPARAGGRGAMDGLLASIHARGSAWRQAVRLSSGDHALRACITSYLTSSEDVDVLVREFELALPRRRGNAG